MQRAYWSRLGRSESQNASFFDIDADAKPKHSTRFRRSSRSPSSGSAPKALDPAEAVSSVDSCTSCSDGLGCSVVLTAQPAHTEINAAAMDFIVRILPSRGNRPLLGRT